MQPEEAWFILRSVFFWNCVQHRMVVYDQYLVPSS